MKTFSAKPADVKRQWHLLDAAALSLGRLSTIAARLLIGKDKPTFTPHVDSGDFVIIINSDQLRVTGAKKDQKKYWRHSGYPGAIRSRTLTEQLERDSTQVIIHSIRGMLPVNKLRDGRLKRLKVYTDEQHPHTGQNPVVYEAKKSKV